MKNIRMIRRLTGLLLAALLAGGLCACGPTGELPEGTTLTELATCDLSWESFGAPLDVSGLPYVGQEKPVSGQPDAVALFTRLLREMQAADLAPQGMECRSIVWFSEDNIWEFDYVKPAADGEPGVSLSVAVDGATGEILWAGSMS